MNIRATFPAGVGAITVHGLTQWDYGRKLEVESSDLPALVQVHFACEGMTDAVVRSCSVTQGKLEAVIPDICLEQTSPVVAWVYLIDDDGTAGTTIKTVILPVTARTRPQAGPSVPEVISDRYTELISAINDQIGALAEGTVVAGTAHKAEALSLKNFGSGTEYGTDHRSAHINDPGLYLVCWGADGVEHFTCLIYIHDLDVETNLNIDGPVYYDSGLQSIVLKHEPQECNFIKVHLLSVST